MASPDRGGIVSCIDSGSRSPTLSQMLFNPELRPARFRYPVYGPTEARKCITIGTPLHDQTATPRAPLSVPAYAFDRSGSKSLGMRRRLKSVENHGSPCLRQKRTATKAENFVSTDFKRQRSVFVPTPCQSDKKFEATAAATVTNYQPVPKLGSRLGCDEKGEQSSVTCGFKTAGNNAINISCKALKHAELLFSKLEKEENLPWSPSAEKQDVTTFQETGIQNDGKFVRISSDEQKGTDCHQPGNDSSSKDIPVSEVSDISNLLGSVGTSLDFEQKKLDFNESTTNRGSVSPMNVARGSTSPVLHNRRMYKKRLRRKIMFSTTKSVSSEIVSSSNIPKAKALAKNDPADSSFLSDDLDSELLAVNLDVKSDIKAENIVETKRNECTVNQCRGSEFPVDKSQVKCTGYKEKCDGEGTKSLKQDSPVATTENTIFSNPRNNNSISVCPDDMQKSSASAVKITTRRKNFGGNCESCCDEAENLTVHSPCPLATGINMVESPKTHFISVRTIQHSRATPGNESNQLASCQANNCVLTSLKRSASVCQHDGNEEMSSDDELLLQIGAEMDRQESCDLQLPSVLPLKPGALAGFTTASKKEIAISGAAMIKAKQIFASLESDRNSFETVENGNRSLPPSDSIKGIDFSLTAAGKNHLGIPNNTSQEVRQPPSSPSKDLSHDNCTEQADNLASSTILKSDGGKDTESFMGFKTASNKQLLISDTALKRAEKLMACFLGDEETARESSTPNECYDKAVSSELAGHKKNHSPETELTTDHFIGFQTASRKPVFISEQALERAQALVLDNSVPVQYDGDDFACPLDRRKLSGSHDLKGLANVFEAGVSCKGGKTNKAFKVPARAMTTSLGSGTADSSQCTDSSISPISKRKKILGIKHFGDSQIAVSDESLVKAVEMLEDLFG